MAGEGNPTDPAQARSASEHTRQSGGATVGPTGARSNPNALADSTSSHNTLEFGRNAGVPDGLRAAETAFVHLCLAKMATVDTTPTSSPSKTDPCRSRSRPIRPVDKIYNAKPAQSARCVCPVRLGATRARHGQAASSPGRRRATPPSTDPGPPHGAR